MRGTILMVCIAALVGCEESTMVGSGCPNGACPEALVRDDDVCVVKADYGSIIPSGDPISDARDCLAEPLERGGDGTVRASVYFLIGRDAEPQIDCTERAFLKPVEAEIRDRMVPDNEPNTTLCEVIQLPVVEGEDGGASIIGAGEGFYYDDFSDPIAARCKEDEPRIVLTSEAQPWDGVIVEIITGEVRKTDGDLDPNLSCEPLQGTEAVGTACSTSHSEYFDSQVVIATRSDDCGQGVCMAYHLGGRIGAGCTEVDGPDGGVVSDPECARSAKIAQKMHCTCRCDGPPGTPDLCECPDGFVCVDNIAPTVPSVAGGYCVMQYPPGQEPVD